VRCFGLPLQRNGTRSPSRKVIAPLVTRVAVVRDSTLSAGVGQWSAIQTAAPSFGIEAIPINLTSAGELERAISEFARAAYGGLIVTSSGLAINYRDLIVTQTARQKLPAVLQPRLCFGRLTDLLRFRSHRAVPQRGALCRSDPQGREAGRSSGASAD
jgi:hypothetical protein